MAHVTSRNNLIPVAAALYRADFAKANREMENISDELKNSVYGKMWEVLGSPDNVSHDFGRTAFYDGNYPLIKKLEAVERAISAQAASRTKATPPLNIPVGARKVTYECHYDGGFDYRFGSDGTYYLDPAKSFWRRPIGAIQDLFGYMMFVLRTTFCRVPKDKEIRTLILKCAGSERTLSSYTYNGLVKSHDKYPIDWIQQLEHDFFEDLSSLYKAFFPSTEQHLRIFPSEMLRPIHVINKPQNKSEQAIHAKPGWINGDLSRNLHIFYRLSEPSRILGIAQNGEAEKVNRQLSLDHLFVPHYIFIDATQKARDDLKVAVRDIRQTLGEVLVNKRSIEALKNDLGEFKTAWDAYTRSHEFLQEAQLYLSQNDFYAPVYDQAKQERTSFFSRWSRKKVGDQTLTGAERRVEEAYLHRQPLTPTGRLFQALQQKAAADKAGHQN